jgi:hypothetical protein
MVGSWLPEAVSKNVVDSIGSEYSLFGLDVGLDLRGASVLMNVDTKMLIRHLLIEYGDLIVLLGCSDDIVAGKHGFENTKR